MIDRIRERIENDKTLKTVLTNTEDAVICKAFDGTIVYWNRKAQELYGYSAEEAIGQSISLIKPANYPVEVPLVDKKIKRGEPVKALETIRVDKSGKIVNVKSNILPLEEEGSVLASIYLEKNNNVHLEISREKKFRKILDNFPDLIFEMDAEYRIIWANSKALEICPTAVGKKCFKVFAGQDAPCEGCALMKAMKSGRSEEGVAHIKRDTNDVEFYFENTAIPLKDQYGNLTEIIEISRDVTSQRKAENELLQTKRKLENSMEAGKIAWWVWDYETGTIQYDKRKAEMADYTHAEFPNDVYEITELVHPDDYDEMMKAMRDHLEGKADEYRIDYRLKKKTGGWVWFHDRGRIIKRTNDGKPLELSGAVIDITQRKKVEERLVEALEKQKEIDRSLKIAKEEAEEASKTKSRFLANMSHEIRTPLNGVLGFSDLLRKTDLNRHQLRYMDNVYNSANSLMDIINDILDFSKIEAGKLELNEEQTNPAEIMENAIEVIKYKANENNIELMLNYSRDLPELVLTDPVRLRQIITNLLSNAVKFTENGEIELSADMIAYDENKETASIVFSVRDTGIGIGEKDQKRIFELFSQAEPSTTKRFGGTGLGLNITNKLLEMMESKLELESNPGEGSVFQFTLDMKVIKDSPQPFKSLKAKNVLVVDDNKRHREIFRDMLSYFSIDATLAKNGKEALKNLKENDEHDIVLMDAEMEDITVHDLIKEYRTLESDKQLQRPQFIVTTNRDDPEKTKAFKELGVERILVKPVTFGKLQSALTSVKDEQPEREKHRTKKATKMTLSKGREKRIMITEDNEVNMELTEAILDNILADIEIIKAVDGVEAVERYKAERPAIVFMDIQMPRMNGYEATRRIREVAGDEKGRPLIIALTAAAVKGEKEKCLEAGMDDYITKPVAEETIQSVLQEYQQIEGFRRDEVIEENEKSHFNSMALMGVLKGRKAVFDRIVKTGKKSLLDGEKKLTEAFDREDTAMIKQAAHKLKGMASNMRFEILGEFSERLQKAAGDNAGLEEQKALYKAIQDEIATLKAILKMD